MKNKVLIIAGQTATGKTSLAVKLAHQFNGELISADSRQVYQGMDIVTGKDRDKIDVPIWLYDLVRPDQPFSVSQWHAQALGTIQNISSRHKLPIVVGGTGLYLRSLIEPLSQISVPPDPVLRSKKLSVNQLQQLLSKETLNKINSSDRLNPRRLVRYIEIAEYNKKTQHPSPKLGEGQGVEYKSIVLTCNPIILKHRISERVNQRIKSGAYTELQNLLNKYTSDSPSFTTCGYRALLHSQNPDDWISSEYQYARRQKTFFTKYFPEFLIDISLPEWELEILDIISSWVSR